TSWASAARAGTLSSGMAARAASSAAVSWRCSVRSASPAAWMRVRASIAPGTIGPLELPVRTHEHDLEAVVGLDAAPGAQHHALERRVDEVYGHLRLVGQPLVEPGQQPAPTDELHAVEDEVLRQLRRAHAEAGHHRVADGRHGLVD